MLKLIKRSEEYFEGYREYCQELYDHGVTFFRPMNPDYMDDGWFARTKSIYDQKETEEATGQARSIHYWAVDDDRFIGEFQLRLDFTDKVMNDIGSVGYAVRVSEWGKGYGSEILRQGIEIARSYGMEKLLFTVNEENVRSIHVIEKLGAKLEDKVTVYNETEGQHVLLRYWVSLDESSASGMAEKMVLSDISICYVTEKYQAEFEQILQEYLPGSELETVKRKAENYPETCLVALKEEKMVGIAFGWPREAALPRKEYCLDGIAVRYEYWGKGIGSELLKAFEEGMLKYGYDMLSVGSAEGLAEKFYLKNGFVPKCFKTYADGQIVVRKEFPSLEAYEKYVRTEEGFVVFEKWVKKNRPCRRLVCDPERREG